MKRILVIGQCTLHWGRMEFGNIGNYYIVEPLFRELHRVFPHAEIVTTMQMTKEFQERENIQVLPMDMYYAWQDNDLEIAQKEYEIAKKYNQTGILEDTTPYMEEVMKSDLVIDFSGDIWGANADLFGKNRFLTGLLKDRIAQLLNKKTVMIAGSHGPFDESNLYFAREVFENFSLVTNREELSLDILKQFKFDTKNVITCACPSVLFSAAPQNNINKYIANTPLYNKTNNVVGFILCGWNIQTGPFNRETYYKEDFTEYIKLIEYCIKTLNCKVCLLSHSNGFELPPHFKLKQGRDYNLLEQLCNFIKDSDLSKDVYLFDGIYSPAETKAIIKNFDLLISGRIHGAVAGLTNNIPTVIIDYANGPKAHKLKGFAKLFDNESYIANPLDAGDMINKVKLCYEKRQIVKNRLEEIMPSIQDKARQNFELLKGI